MCASGDVQIGLMDKKGQLEVEVIRARGLTPKPGSKSLPGKSFLILLLTYQKYVTEEGILEPIIAPQRVLLYCFPFFSLYRLIDLMILFAVHSSICQGLLAG